MAGGHRFDSTVLREYDIRGVVGRTLHEADAAAIGRAFGTLIVDEGGKSVAVGYDGRLSSPDLEAALVDGFAECGLEVFRVGRGPTPMLYYAVHSLNAGGGIMVTGSHNPPDHNGFKMMLGHDSFYGEAIRKLGQLAESGTFTQGAGTVIDRPMLEEYVTRLMENVEVESDLIIAWDAGNGAAGEAMVMLTQDLPGHHILLNEEIDGTFPNHHPDPTVEANLEQLRACVLDKGCDIGFAFDGDGDRIGALDGKGRILWADQLMVLFARDVLEHNPGATIIADVKASGVLFDEIARFGGNPLMWRTGHSLIKSKMREKNAPLAGEMSGHIFFADRYYGFDDALYAAVRLVEILAHSGESLADFHDRLPSVLNTPELRFDCAEERKFAVVEEVRERLAVAGANVTAIDGVRVNTDDGWWLLRASNTQAVLVARCEAADSGGLDRLKAQLADQLDKSGVALPEF
ncbi:MAG: phosphomannomutase/phosphoglucomutase [Alphaproteobacteria bacterium]|nr:phosphomannomutase/phosphoglucomutase [Alphaproteobacteria bacterium]